MGYVSILLEQDFPKHYIQSSIDIRTVKLFIFGKFDSFLAGLCIKSTVHVSLPKRPKKQFNPVWQSRKQALRAYCPNIYTVN